MEFQTPGVYVREVDSGSKPIASVPTSIPGFLGLFHQSITLEYISLISHVISRAGKYTELRVR